MPDLSRGPRFGAAPGSDARRSGVPRRLVHRRSPGGRKPASWPRAAGLPFPTDPGHAGAARQPDGSGALALRAFLGQGGSRSWPRASGSGPAGHDRARNVARRRETELSMGSELRPGCAPRAHPPRSAKGSISSYVDPALEEQLGGQKESQLSMQSARMTSCVTKSPFAPTGEDFW